MLRTLFLPYIILEIIFAYFFVEIYSFVTLLFEIFLTAVIGLFCIFNVGFMNLRSNFAFLKPSDIFSSLGVGIGGFFLFLPGLLTDIIGAVLVVLSLVYRKNDGAKNKFYYEDYKQTKWQNFNDNGEIIDVEIVDESKSVR